MVYSVRGEAQGISCEIVLICVDSDVLPPQHPFELF